jgi:hypothetical protein
MWYLYKLSINAPTDLMRALNVLQYLKYSAVAAAVTAFLL